MIETSREHLGWVLHEAGPENADHRVLLLPGALADLTVATTVGGITAGPFISPVPTPPAGWTAYTYASVAGGTFSITTAGDSATVTVP